MKYFKTKKIGYLDGKTAREGAWLTSEQMFRWIPAKKFKN